MGLVLSADVFQEAMGNIMEDLKKVFVYIDDNIIIENDAYELHMKDVEELSEWLATKGLQVNPNKSS